MRLHSGSPAPRADRDTRQRAKAEVFEIVRNTLVAKHNDLPTQYKDPVGQVQKSQAKQ